MYDKKLKESSGREKGMGTECINRETEHSTCMFGNPLKLTTRKQFGKCTTEGSTPGPSTNVQPSIAAPSTPTGSTTLPEGSTRMPVSLKQKHT